jgi:hypothetical protein
LTLAQWCKLLVKRATQVMTTENAFREWQKGHMSAADKEELEMLRRWRNGLAVQPAAKTYVAAVKDPKSEPTTSDGFNGICRKCNQKGHRAKNCPANQPAPPAKTAPAKAKTRQVANVVAAETVAEPQPATVTLTNKQPTSSSRSRWTGRPSRAIVASDGAACRANRLCLSRA